MKPYIKLIIVVTILVLLYHSHMAIYGYPNVLAPHTINSLEKHVYGADAFSMTAPNKGFAATISFWMYIKDWSYRLMHEKSIFNKGGFSLYLSAKNGQLILEMPVYNSKLPEIIKFNDVPSQKWINITVVNDNRHMDLWINGKLYVSKYLKNLPDIDNTRPLVITDNGGYDGHISRLTGWNYPVSKAVIARVFKAGPVDISLYGKTIGRIVNFFKKYIPSFS